MNDWILEHPWMTVLIAEVVVWSVVVVAVYAR
jgi:hypothetical protein